MNTVSYVLKIRTPYGFNSHAAHIAPAAQQGSGSFISYSLFSQEKDCKKIKKIVKTDAMMLTSNKTETYFADISGERVDACVARLAGVSRSAISALIGDGFCSVNGKIPKKSYSLHAGDAITVHFPPEKTPDITPKNIPFKILLNRSDYAIIDKPAGVVVHPAPGHYDDTLVNALLYTFHIEDKDNGFRPGIVHRLDKDTSGALIIAKNAVERAKLSKLFSDRLIKKTYIALCAGKPDFIEKRIEAPIGRDKSNRKKMCVSENGRSAISIFRVREVFKNAFLAEVQILTGRTHQIRVHAAYMRHPIVGDKLYGGAAYFEFKRQALHSYKISFTDPDTNENVSVVSELPDDILNLIANFKAQ